MSSALDKLYFAIDQFDKGRGYEYTFVFRPNNIVIKVEDKRKNKKYSWSVTVKEIESMKIDIVREYLERMVESFDD